MELGSSIDELAGAAGATSAGEVGVGVAVGEGVAVANFVTETEGTGIGFPEHPESTNATGMRSAGILTRFTRRCFPRHIVSGFG